MIADFQVDDEDLPEDFPCSVKQGQMSVHPFSPAPVRVTSTGVIACMPSHLEPEHKSWRSWRVLHSGNVSGSEMSPDGG